MFLGGTMKQRNAVKKLTFSALTFSMLVSVAAHAQLIEIDPPAGDAPDVSQQTTTRGSVQSPSGILTTQPVGVSAGMNPQVVPSAQTAQAASQVGNVSNASALSSGTLSTVSSPSTVMPGGNSTGNSNGPGTQINLNIQNDQQAKQAQEADQSRLSELRMEKKIREKVNEERLMEKIEEDRVFGEKTRTGGIERFSFGTSESAPVSIAAADAGALGAGSSATAIAVAGTTNSGNGFMGTGVNFRLAPVVGWRWYQMYPTAYRPVNMVTAGLTLEGDVSSWFAFEGNFMYGRDRYRVGAMPYGMGGAAYMGGAMAQPMMSGGYNTMGYSPFMPQSRDTYEATVGGKFGYQFARVRPFAAVDFGGIFQRYNIDAQYTVDQLRYAGLQRATNYFMGNFGAGADVTVAKNFAVGGRFDYQAIFNGIGRLLPMNQIWGDTANRLRLTASAQLVF